MITSAERPGIVAIPYHDEIDGITEVISDELDALGYQPVPYQTGSPVPEGAEAVFSFGPYGKFLTIPGQLAEAPREKKPVFIHWNTEGLPDPRIPWRIMSAIAEWRSWLERVQDLRNRPIGTGSAERRTSFIEGRMLRFRYLGDYYYAHRKGWLDIFADTSAVYADFHRRHGLPTLVAHWGATARWHEDLGLERDIDVLWIGKRGTGRRNDLLDRVRSELKAHGVRMHVADGNENPFVFGEERTWYLNRSKITLNLTRTWYDDNFSRFALAAPNRSLVISERVLDHCPKFVAGTHYVSVAAEKLAGTILYYLDHKEERAAIVNNAYDLVMTELLFRNSIRSIMDAAERAHQSRAQRPVSLAI
jgi:hypothetical protein